MKTAQSAKIIMGGGTVNLALVTLTKCKEVKNSQPDTSVSVGKAERIRKPITGKKIREGH